LSSLRERVSRKPFDQIHDALQHRCELILETAPIDESKWRLHQQQGVPAAAMQAARTTQGRIMDLLVSHHVDPNPAYRDRAAEELRNLVNWTVWSDPTHKDLSVDLCTAEAAVAVVVGLDWLWEDLPETDRLRAVQALRHRAVEAYQQAVRDKAWWYDCYHSWNAVVNSGCGLAALALSEEEPAAQKAYRTARDGLQKFFNALGREGGWDEGVAYWGYAMRYVLLLAEASARVLDDQSLYHTRGMDATGLFPVYFTPNGHAAGFGPERAEPLFGTFYLLGRHFGLPETTRWLDTYGFHRDAAAAGWASAGLGLLFRPVDADVRTKCDLLTTKVFHEIGWAALADHWPTPGLYAAVRAGDLSAHSSAHNMNAVQLQVNGELILCDSGNGHIVPADAEDLDEPARARSHNTLIVAGRDHQLDARGAIVEAQGGKNYRWVACDSGGACGENVSFVRHVVMLVEPAAQKGRAVVVVDEIVNGVPETVELFWHTRGRVLLDAASRAGVIEGRNGPTYFGLASTVKTSLRTGGEESNGRQILAMTGGVADRAQFVSVFARAPVTKLQVKPTASGLRISFGGSSLEFKDSRRRLQVQNVKL